MHATSPPPNSRSASFAARPAPPRALLATLPTARLDEMLDEIAAQLEKDAPAIFAANAKDIAAAEDGRACTRR